MEIPASRWFEAIARRKSQRAFDGTALAPALRSHLDSVCARFNPFPGARAVLVAPAPERAFRGFLGNLGTIGGAGSFVAFIGDTADEHVNEKIGYVGEGIVLEATALDLATCWVGGFFRKDVVESLLDISRNEKVFAVTPLGRPADRASNTQRIISSLAGSRRRKPVLELVEGLDRSRWPGWMTAALEAARIGPSAVNRQPWRFHLEPDSITVSTAGRPPSFGISRRLDCGIAMLHIEVAALAAGVQGSWGLLESPGVARFTVRGA